MSKFYAISSNSIYIKNKAILKAGNTRPTNGTKIDGKKDDVIIIYLLYICICIFSLL